jgi:hypothetical protein
MELRKQPPELNTQSEEGSLLLPMALRQQPPKVNNQCEELPLLSPLVETIEPPKSLHDSELRVKCDFELEVLESLSSDSEKSMSPGENTAVSLLSLSDNDNSDGEHITKGLIPQCNWRFEHCFLKVIQPIFASSLVDATTSPMSGVLLYGLYRMELPLMTPRVLDCGVGNTTMGVLILFLLTRLITGLTAGGKVVGIDVAVRLS